MNVPDDLKFAPSHEWLRISDGRVGVSDHAQAELSDVVYVDLPKVGRKVAAGEVVAVVESVKAASDIYSPVSGEVVAVNEALSSDSALVNTDPYGNGWIFEIKPSNSDETGKLLDAEGYRKQIGGE
jgi:glycine cleavage system H protein